jgi:HK97 family phage major capsid protein
VKKIIEMRQKRAQLIKDARDILDKAEKENRSLTAEEKQEYDRRFKEINELGDSIETEERQAELERGLTTVSHPAHRPEPGSPVQRGTDPRETEEYRTSFNHYLQVGLNFLSADESRALQVTDKTLGGFVVTPQQFVNDLLKAIDNALVIRQLATVLPLGSAESLGVPTLDSDISDADWTSELATGAEDTAMKFGKRELKPHPLAKRIKVSNKLLAQSAINIDQLVRDRLAYKFGVAMEKAYMTGDGVDKPLGLFVASANGISTGRDVSDGNTTTSIQTDGLISAKYTLKEPYWMNARWLFHRNAMEQIHKLKDTNGQYLIQPNLQNGPADRLLGIPVVNSEYVPNTFTTGQYVGMIGDFSKYWVADSLALSVQRLVELYAETNQIGFIGRLETDAMPVLEEAFIRVKLA